MKQKRILIISITAMLLISVSVIAFVVFQNPHHSKETVREAIAATETSVSETVLSLNSDESTIPSESASEKITEAATETSITAPEELEQILAENNNTVDQLTSLGCCQLITVESHGTSAKIDFYRMADNEWVKDETLSCSGYIGSNGVTEDMHEGGYATPKGLYSISDAFYIYEAPVTGLSSFQVTNDTYWVDDPNSVYYNQHIEGTANKDWVSAEHMIDYTTAYEYGCVIDYNTEAAYNAGSAIFFHVSYGPTAGCVGTDRTMVLRYLASLDKSQNPYIVII